MSAFLDALFLQAGYNAALVVIGWLFFLRWRRLLPLVVAHALYDGIQEPMLRIEAAAGEVRARYSRASLRVSVQPFFASEFFVPRLS